MTGGRAFILAIFALSSACSSPPSERKAERPGEQRVVSVARVAERKGGGDRFICLAMQSHQAAEINRPTPLRRTIEARSRLPARSSHERPRGRGLQRDADGAGFLSAYPGEMPVAWHNAPSSKATPHADQRQAARAGPSSNRIGLDRERGLRMVARASPSIRMDIRESRKRRERRSKGGETPVPDGADTPSAPTDDRHIKGAAFAEIDGFSY